MRDSNQVDRWLKVGQIWEIVRDPIRVIRLVGPRQYRLQVGDKFLITGTQEHYDDVSWVNIALLNGEETALPVHYFEVGYFLPAKE